MAFVKVDIKSHKTEGQLPLFMPHVCHQFKKTTRQHWFLICSDISWAVEKKSGQRGTAKETT